MSDLSVFKSAGGTVIPERSPIHELLDHKDVKMIRSAKIFWCAVDHYYSLKEISAFLRLSIGTIGSDFDNFIRKIRHSLKEEGNDNYLVFEKRDLDNIRGHLRYFDAPTLSIVRGQFGVDVIIKDFVDLKAEKAERQNKEKAQAERLAQRDAARRVRQGTD
ncbi:hypothetical protein [Methylobacterium sp.]|uniref:hypothetical protein n=1 Tax=Methylobacterium sp. TaxID=409 RepID=UPI0025F35C37|nr:hypothetical protein [Methylobacterium sp.]MBY0259580.1 hypothetical protein [Methylobacterium sp.]